MGWCERRRPIEHGGCGKQTYARYIPFRTEAQPHLDSSPSWVELDTSLNEVSNGLPVSQAARIAVWLLVGPPSR